MKNKIKKLIEDNKIREALNLLEMNISDDEQNSVIIFKSNLQRFIKKQISSGTEWNEFIYNILSFTENIEFSENNSFSDKPKELTDITKIKLSDVIGRNEDLETSKKWKKEIEGMEE